MPLVTTGTTPASCGHPQTGSTRVFIQGKGVSRVDVDSAGGLIVGPGSQNVFIENKKVSFQGDAITGHGESPHGSPRTVAGQEVVNVGTGFRGDTDSTGEAPRADIIVTLFEADKTELHCSGQNIYPPTNMVAANWECHPDFSGVFNTPPPPTVNYSYTVKNVGQDVSQAFTIGFYRFNDLGNIPNQVVIVQAAEPFFPGSELITTQQSPSLLPGQTFSGVFQFPEHYATTPGLYVFGLSPDLYQEVTEVDEANTVTTIRVTVDNDCF